MLISGIETKRGNKYFCRTSVRNQPSWFFENATMLLRPTKVTNCSLFVLSGLFWQKDYKKRGLLDKKTRRMSTKGYVKYCNKRPLDGAAVAKEDGKVCRLYLLCILLSSALTFHSAGWKGLPRKVPMGTKNWALSMQPNKSLASISRSMDYSYLLSWEIQVVFH